MGAGNMTAISANALLSCQKPSKLGPVAFSYGLSAADQNAFYTQEKSSFPAILQKHGIKTGMIGNVSIISEVLGIGVNHGFDEQISIEMESYDAPHITRAAIDWLQDNGHKPFFLYVHYNTTHAPYRAPLHDILATLNGLQSLESQRSFLLSLYQAEIRYVDRYLESLAKALHKLGLDQKTILVLNSDHGDAHELRTYSENEAGPAYRGSMFDHVGTLLYNDVLHVPLLISLPGLKKGKKIQEIVSGLDIGPTVLQFFGLQIPKWCDGLPLLSATALKERIVVGSEGYDQRAIFFKNRFKYTKSYASSEKRMTPASGYFTKNASIFIREQLFDLKIDPEEKVNLVQTHAELLQETRTAFRDYFDIRDGTELIIDAPAGEKVEVFISNNEIQNLAPVEKFKRNAENTVLEFSDTKRIVLHFYKAPRTIPTVRVGGKDIPLKFSSLRLPLHILPKDLPDEGIDLDSLSIGRTPAALFVKIRGDQSLQQKFSIGNKHFEKIFKDWGYLNDGN